MGLPDPKPHPQVLAAPATRLNFPKIFAPSKKSFGADDVVEKVVLRHIRFRSIISLQPYSHMYMAMSILYLLKQFD